MDGDGLINLMEFKLGLSASNPDTDGVSDGSELNRGHSQLPMMRMVFSALCCHYPGGFP